MKKNYVIKCVICQKKFIRNNSDDWIVCIDGGETYCPDHAYKCELLGDLIRVENLCKECIKQGKYDNEEDPENIPYGVCEEHLRYHFDCEGFCNEKICDEHSKLFNGKIYCEDCLQELSDKLKTLSDQIT